MTTLTPKIRQALNNVLHRLDLHDLDQAQEILNGARVAAYARARADWRPGESVLFVDRPGVTHCGTVISCNQKTLTIETEDPGAGKRRWRVSYGFCRKDDKEQAV